MLTLNRLEFVIQLNNQLPSFFNFIFKMRLRFLKQKLLNCIRKLFVITFYLLIIILILINLLKTKCENKILLLSDDDLLDKCMLDDNPCYPDINKSLNRYFNLIKTKYSMLLTYHPIIDCNSGRYLLINDEISSHMYHGTGSQLMWYLGILNIAYELNLTLIHNQWTSEHILDETNFEREKYFKFFDWEISRSAYESCPLNSSIKKHRFNYNLIWKQTFDQYHQNKKRFKIKENFQLLFDKFLSKLPTKNSGFTFYSNSTYTITSSLMDIGIVFETRWWLQHRKSYHQYSGVWSSFPILSNYFPQDYFQFNSTILKCSSINIKKTLLIGIHIRHGDVIQRNKKGKIISADLYRYISISAYKSLLISIINLLPDYLNENYLITIYSEGFLNDFSDLIHYLKENLPLSRCRLAFFLNGKTSETLNRLLRDDILITTFSTFSMASGIFNSRQLKIGPFHNRARIHGMRNYLSLELNRNHTKFLINQTQILLIKERIIYIWNEKQKQQNTSIPLWLKNYSEDYPEQFMLI